MAFKTENDQIKRRNELLGLEFKTNSSGRCFIVDYKSASNVTVLFYEPLCAVKCEFHNLRKGKVANPMLVTVGDRGYLGIGKYKQSVHTDIYDVWAGLINRCYKESYLVRCPTYENVTVCEEWWCFQNFASWCESQEFFGAKDDNGKSYHLDKDILSKNDKIYSPETCCFVPYDINAMFATKRNKHKTTLLGASLHRKTGKFRCQMNRNGVNKYLGTFDTQEEAFFCYKTAKESYIKEVANKWRAKIDKRVYKALINYELDNPVEGIKERLKDDV